MKHLLFGLLLMSGAVFAKEAGNGGNSVVGPQGEKILRDLIDKSICTWMPGDQAMTYFKTEELNLDLDDLEEKTLKGIIDSTKEEDRIRLTRIFRTVNFVKKDLKKMSWCLTDAPLHRVEVEDLDSVITAYQGKINQVAIRIGNDVFLDVNEFKAMDPESQKLLFLHESLHMIVNNPQRHNSSVRSTVRSINKFQKNEIDLTVLAYQFDKNNVGFIGRDSEYDWFASFKSFNRDLQELKKIGLPRLLQTGLSIGNLKEVGFSFREIFDIAKDKFSPTEFVMNSTPDDIHPILKELRDRGLSLYGLSQRYSRKDFSKKELIQAGYTCWELEEVGLSTLFSGCKKK